MLSIPSVVPWAAAPVRSRARHVLPVGPTRFLAGERPIVAFREVATGRMFVVPDRSGHFWLGRERRCDLWLPRVGVEGREWELWWHRDQLWVEDMTFEWRTTVLLPAPGQCLRAGAVSLRALSSAQVAACRALADYLDADVPTIDRTLDHLGRTTTLIVLGGRDAGPHSVMGSLHRATPSSAGIVAPTQEAPIPAGHALWLDLRSGAGAIAAQAMDRARARIRSGRCGLRVIATSRAEVEQWLGRIPDEALVVEVPNVRDRRAAIPRLFAEAMARRECPLELDDLGEANARALLDHDWPGNRDEIATVAAHLAQAVKDPSHAEIALDALKGYGVVFDPRPPAEDMAKWRAYDTQRRARHAAAIAQSQADRLAALGLSTRPAQALRRRPRRASEKPPATRRKREA